jgi:hypothetical protein
MLPIRYAEPFSDVRFSSNSSRGRDDEEEEELPSGDWSGKLHLTALVPPPGKKTARMSTGGSSSWLHPEWAVTMSQWRGGPHPAPGLG